MKRRTHLATAGSLVATGIGGCLGSALNRIEGDRDPSETVDAYVDALAVGDREAVADLAFDGGPAYPDLTQHSSNRPESEIDGLFEATTESHAETLEIEHVEAGVEATAFENPDTLERLVLSDDLTALLDGNDTALVRTSSLGPSSNETLIEGVTVRYERETDWLLVTDNEWVVLWNDRLLDGSSDRD